MTPWLLTEIATGLQKLHLLSLDRTPAADVIAGTAQAWCEAIEHGRAFDQHLDTKRIRAAFVTLAANVDRWPSPRQFLDALPGREQLALTKQTIPADPERAKQHIAEIARTLTGRDAAAGPDA